jgi:hypothetical protein
MVRIGTAAAVGTLTACLLFACGDKNYPLSPSATGGAAGTGLGGVAETGGTSGEGGTIQPGIDGGEDIDGGMAVDGGITGAGGVTGAGGASGTGGSTGTTVSFKLQIMPLLEKSCSCHVTGGFSPLLDNYADTKAAASASNQAIKDGTMPPGGSLSAADQALFQSWIDAKTPNN